VPRGAGGGGQEFELWGGGGEALGDGSEGAKGDEAQGKGAGAAAGRLHAEGMLHGGRGAYMDMNKGGAGRGGYPPSMAPFPDP